MLNFINKLNNHRSRAVLTDLTTFGFEVFAKSRPNLMPNPEIDSINTLFFLVSNEKAKYSSTCEKYQSNIIANFSFEIIMYKVSGLIIVDDLEFENLKTMKHKIKVFYSKIFILH